MVSTLTMAMALQALLSPRPTPYPPAMKQAVHAFVAKNAQVPAPSPAKKDPTFFHSKTKVNLPVNLLKQAPESGRCSIPLHDALAAKPPVQDFKMLRTPPARTHEREPKVKAPASPCPDWGK
jgi:hypothetical protein